MAMAGSLRSQNAPASSAEAERARHRLAISLLRGINTAEAEYMQKHGAYAKKDTLLASEEFKGKGWAWPVRMIHNWRSQSPRMVRKSCRAWSLRLNVTADGKSYDVLLEDTTDKSCAYAAVTDERGIIRQSKAIDCQI